MGKTIVQSKDSEGNALSLAVIPPSGKIHQGAKLYRAKVYRQCVEGGVLIKEQLDKHLKEMNLWDDGREAEFEQLRKAILEGELLLRKKKHPDGSVVKLNDARDVAIRMSRSRASLQDLLSVRQRVEANTADSIADQAQFEYYVVQCTVYNDGRYEGKPYFTKDGINPLVEEYAEKKTEPAAFDAATKVSEILYGGNTTKELPEQKFLKQFKFVDDEGFFIDSTGCRTDDKGRRIDPDGYLIDSDGNRVDAEGNKIDQEGMYVEDTDAHFVDEEGNPV